MSCWGSNATWQRQGAWFSCRKGGKACSHVALEERHVVLGLQRDVAEKEPKARATSHWRGAMSRWESNATWLRQGAWFLREKGTKTGRHVALGECHVLLGLQRDVAEAVNLVFARKRSKNRAPHRIGVERCLVGSPTRRGCGHPLHLLRKKIGRLSKLVL